MVVIFHFFQINNHNNFIHNFELGNSAVITFLFITGYYNFFLISKFKQIKNYIYDRFLRLYPLYLFSIIIIISLNNYENINFTSLILEIILIPKSFEFLFIDKIKNGFLNPVTWSLAVELIIFMIFPFIIKKINEKLLIKFLVIGLISHAFLISTNLKYLDIFEYLEFEKIFNFGEYSANAYINYIFSYKSIFPLILIFSLGYLYAKKTNNIKFILLYLTSFFFINSQSRIDVLIGIFIFIPLAVILAKSKRSKLDNFFGMLSYPVFLIHYPLIEYFKLNLFKIYLFIILISLFLLFIQNFLDKYRYSTRVK